MSVLKVKKLVAEAVLPSKAHPNDEGFDCVAIDNGKWSSDGRYIEYGTGIAIEVPEGYYVKLYSRSSISKYDLLLANGVGVVDNGYRGELKFRFKLVLPTSIDIVTSEGISYIDDGGTYTGKIYKQGDKIGQIVIEKSNNFFSIEEVEELSDTQRGTGGFGSSDRR